ncbi:MAG: hypothetical protein ACTSWN_07780 [Promethearchaeota archaeon]
MTREIKAIKKLKRLPINKLREIGVKDIQEKIFYLITDLQKNERKKLKLIADLFLKIYKDDKKFFYSLIPPFLDFIRGNPKVDIFTLMLVPERSGALTTKELARLYEGLLDRGLMTPIEFKTFLPKDIAETKQISLLAMLLKNAMDDEAIQEVILDLMIDLIVPESMLEFEPVKMISFEMFNRVMRMARYLVTLQRKNYPAYLILERIGERSGIQSILLILMLMEQIGIKDREMKALLNEIDNPLLSNMFFQAKKMADTMLPPSMKKDAAPPFPTGSMLPSSIPDFPGSKLIRWIMKRFFRRFMRDGSSPS